MAIVIRIIRDQATAMSERVTSEPALTTFGADETTFGTNETTFASNVTTFDSNAVSLKAELSQLHQ